MTSSIKPSWLGEAVLSVLRRLDDQRRALLRGPRSSEVLEQIAALHERQARCWRILARHADEPIVWRAMLAAESHYNDNASNYRDMADIRRTSERWTEARASFSGAA